MSQPLRALIVEDDDADVQDLLDALRNWGFAAEWMRVQTAQELRWALSCRPWDVVFSDYRSAQLDAEAALRQSQAHDPDLPFLVVSRDLGQENAARLIRSGVADCLIKGRLARLGSGVQHELRRAATRRSERRRERELVEAKQRLQALSNRMIEFQEVERREIARMLHDDVGQLLTAIKLNLQALERRVTDEAAKPLIADVTTLTGEVLDQVRALSLDLRPPHLDDLGLVPALQWLVKRTGRARPTVSLHAGDATSGLPPHVATTCYRTAQEALANALRHGEAQRIDVVLEQRNGGVELAIIDDGRGFDSAVADAHARNGGSMGLLGMQERVALTGGEFELITSPGKGTTVRAFFALPAPEKSADKADR